MYRGVAVGKLGAFFSSWCSAWSPLIAYSLQDIKKDIFYTYISCCPLQLQAFLACGPTRPTSPAFPEGFKVETLHILVLPLRTKGLDRCWRDLGIWQVAGTGVLKICAECDFRCVCIYIYIYMYVCDDMWYVKLSCGLVPVNQKEARRPLVKCIKLLSIFGH